MEAIAASFSLLWMGVGGTAEMETGSYSFALTVDGSRGDNRDGDRQLQLLSHCGWE